MRNFMCDYILDAIRNAERPTHFCIRIRIEKRGRKHDSARVFHAAKSGRADDQCQLLIRIRCDYLTEKLESRRGGCESLQSFRAVRVWYIVRKRGESPFCKFKTDQIVDAPNHAI